MKILRFCGLAVLLLWGTAWAQTPGLSFPNAVGVSGSTVTVPVVLESSIPISAGQVVVEFDANVLQFDGAEMAPGISGISISNVNPDLPFDPVTSGATDNVLVQFSGTRSVDGQTDIVLLHFTAVGAPGSVSPLAFDRGTDRTSLTTTGRITLAGGDLTFADGTFTTLPGGIVAIRIPDVVADPGGEVHIPVEISTDLQIGVAQVTVDYDGGILSFLGAEPGPDAAGFSVSNVNADLPFAPGTPNTTDNVLVQVSGGGQGVVTGQNRSFLVLRFGVSPDASRGAVLPLGIDPAGDRTNASTVGLQTVRGEGLALSAGAVFISRSRVQVSPPILNFGSVQVGQEATATFTVKNSVEATSDLTVTGIALKVGGGPFSLSGFTLPLVLAPGASQAVTVRFSPAVAGAFGDTVRVESNDPGLPVAEVGLSGEGVRPIVQVPEAGLDFGGVMVGEVASATFTVSNAAEATSDLEVSGIVLEDTSGVFSLSSVTFPLVLGPAVSQEFTVTFSPVVSGVFGGKVRVESNDPGLPVAEVGLSGEGVRPIVVVPDSAIDFGTVLIEEEISTTFVIANAAEATSDLEVTGIVLEDASGAFSLSPVTLPLVLGAGASQEVSVTFVSPVAGSFAATVLIESNDPEVPVADVGLLGEASGNTPTGSDVAVAPVDPATGTSPVTLGFAGITEAGQTTVQRIDPPALPPDVPRPTKFRFAGRVFDLQTTAIYTGPVTLTFRYADADVPPGFGEDALQVYHYADNAWKKLPALARDASGNTIAVSVSHLSYFAIGVDLTATLVVAPVTTPPEPPLDMGMAVSPQTTSETFTIANDAAATADLTVTRVDLEDPTVPFALFPGPVPFTLVPGESRQVEVVFGPKTPGNFTGKVLVESNDPDRNPQDPVLYLKGYSPAPPAAAFSASPTSGPPPLAVDFRDRSTGDITAWFWNLGPVTTDNRSPSYVYQDEGTYTVSLTVAGPGGSSTVTKEGLIRVQRAPGGSIQATSGTSGPAPLPVGFAFNSTGGPIDSYTWDFGDGGSGSGQSVSHTYTAQGTYSVAVTVTGPGGGLTVTFPTQIVVEVQVVAPDPPAGHLTGPASAVAGEAAGFSFASTGGPVTGYEWDFGDGSPHATAGPAVTHVYGSPGDYTVALTVTGPGGGVTLTGPVSVRARPPAGTASADPTSGAAPLQVDFAFTPSADSGPITDHVWDFGDGFGGVGAQAVHLYEAQGTYTVTVTVTGPGGEVTVPAGTIQVTPPGLPGGEIAAEPLSGPAPLSVDFSLISTGGPIDTFVWDFGDGATGEGARPLHVYGGPGIYTVAVRLVGPGGEATVEAVDLIQVLDRRPAGGFAADPTSGPVPLVVNFTFQEAPESGPITGYWWDFGDGSPVEVVTDPTRRAISHTYIEAGTYTVRLTLEGPGVIAGGPPAVVERVNLITVAAADQLYADFEAVPEVGRAPLAVVFTDRSGGGTGLTYLWDFGDANAAEKTSTEQNPTHTYNFFGDYTVTLTVTDDQNRTAEKTKRIRAQAAQPVLTTNADRTEGFAPFRVQFGSVVDPRGPNLGTVTYAWDFGDGGTSNLASPEYTFLRPGSYIVSLTVEGPGGVARKEIPVEVQAPPPPAGEITADPASGFSPLAVAFTFAPLPGSGPVDADGFLWDFGDGTASSDPNPLHTYPEAGTYTVGLTLRGPGGETTVVREGMVTVEGLAPIKADFATDPVFPNETARAPLTVRFTDLSSGVGRLSYLWDFGDPTSGIYNASTLQNPSHRFAAFGDYEVTLVVIDELGRVSEPATAVLPVRAQRPVVSIGADVDGGYAPLRVAFTGTVGPAGPNLGEVTYAWDFGDGTASDRPDPTHIFEASGTYDVELTVRGPGGEGTATHRIVVEAPAAPAGEIVAAPERGFAPLVSGFTFASTGGPVEVYEWDFGDGTPVSNEAFPVHKFTDAGTYTVRVKLTGPPAGGAAPEVFETTAQVVVDARPPAGMFAARPATGLVGLAPVFTFTPLPESGPIVEYRWDFGDGTAEMTTAAPTATHQYTAAGTYDVRLTLVGASGKPVALVRPGLVAVRETGALAANFTASAQEGRAPFAVSFTNQSAGTPDGVLTYEWDFGDGTPQSAQRDPSHTFARFGTYTVTLKVTEQLADGTTRAAEKAAEVRALAAPPVASAGADVLEGIAPLAVRFESTVGPAGPNLGTVTYQWGFGDGEASSLPNPVHTFQAAGTYKVSLKVTGPGGETTRALQVEVYAPAAPSGQIAAEPAGGAAPLRVSFSFVPDDRGGPVEGYEWDFGDGTETSTQPRPIHVYAAPGTYDVTLTAAGRGAGNTARFGTQVAVLAHPPAGTFAASPASGFLEPSFSTTFTFTADPESGPVQSYQWDFDGDGTADQVTSEPGVTHAYTQAGKYTVVLTLVGPDAEVALVRTDYIDVRQAGELIANFTASAQAGRAPFTVTFTDLSAGQGDLTYAWDFGDPASGTFNTSAQRNPSHTYRRFGDYTVRLTVTDEVAGRQAEKTLQIRAQAAVPAVRVRADRRQGDAPLRVQFGSTVGPAGPNLGTVTYQWTFGDGTAPESAPNPAHTFRNPGSYTVVLTVTGEEGDVVERTVGVEALAAPAPAGIVTAEPASGYGPLPVQFAFRPNLTSGQVEAYLWNFGDGASSAESAPVHTYTQPGVYTVSLRASGPGGETSITQADFVQVRERPPVGVIAADRPSGFAPLEDVTFTFQKGRSSGKIDTYLWDFGDGSAPETGTGAPVQHTFVAPGTYTVSVTAAGPGGEATFTRENFIEVRAPGELIANFSASVQEGPAPLAVVFMNQSSSQAGTLSYAWGFDDEASGPLNTSTQRNPTHIFNAPGDYTVALTLTERVPGGPVRTAEKTLEVRVLTPAPIVRIGAEPLRGVAPLEVDFESTVAPRGVDLGELTYRWDFGDGTPGAEEAYPVHLFQNPGTYTVSLTVAGAGGEGRVETTVEVLSPPAPAGQIVFEPASGLAPLPVRFTFAPGVASGPVDTYTWDFGDGQGSADASPTHTYGAAGVYRASVVLEGPGGRTTVTQQGVVEVEEPPPAGVFAADPVSGFAPLSVQFTFAVDEEVSGPIDRYTWDFGDGTGSAGVNTAHTYEAAGTYTVSLTLEGPGGRTTLIQEGLVEVGQPGEIVANFTAVPETGGAPLTVAFTNRSVGSGALTYSWDFGDLNSGPSNTSAAKDPVHTYNLFGDYTVVLTVTDALGRTAEKRQFVRVRAAVPEVRIGADVAEGVAPLSVQFASTVGPQGPNLGQVTYLWDFGDGTAPEDTAGPVHLFESAGTYTVRLTVTGQGGQGTDELAVRVRSQPPPAGRIAADVVSGIAAAQEPLVVTFAFRPSQAQAGGPADTYVWDFGDGTAPLTTVVPEVAHPYTAPGIYTVSATVTGPGGQAVLRQPDMIEVGAPGDLVANFDVSATSGPAPLSVTFTDRSTGEAPMSYFWNFGDPGSGALNASTNKDEMHTYKLFGEYTVGLTVQDALGRSAVKTKTVRAQASRPEVAVTADPMEGSAPLTVAFTGQVGPVGPNLGRVKYRWDFGDGTSSTAQAPQPHTFEKPGKYAVTLAVTGPGGGGVSRPVEIAVAAPRPPAGRFAADPVSGVVPAGGMLPVAFAFTKDEATSGPIDRYTWDFGDGSEPVTTTEPGAAHDYAAGAQPYTVGLTVEGPGGKVALEQEGLIEVRPEGSVVANFTYSPEAGMAPLEVAFTDRSRGVGGTLSYAWNFGDAGSEANASTDRNPTHSYAKYGDYTVTLTVTDGLQPEVPAVKTKTVHIQAPAPGVLVDASVAEGSDATVLQGTVTGPVPLEVTFTSAVDDKGIAAEDLAYTWDFGDGGALTGEDARGTVAHIFQAAGTYTVRLTVDGPDAAGTAGFQVVALFPNRLPGAPVFTSPKDGATGQPLNTALVWQPGVDPDGDAVTYRIYMGAERQAPVKVAEGITATGFTVGPLAQNTLYTCVLEGVDSRGGVSPAVRVRFTTVGDTEPPVIQSPQATALSSSSLRVRWETNEPATSQVDYRLVSGAGFTEGQEADLSGVLSHSVTLEGLTTGETYVLRISSRDVSANQNVSSPVELTVKLFSELLPLAFTTEPTVLSRTPVEATVYWETNRLSSTLGDLLEARPRSAKQAQPAAAFQGRDGEAHTLVFDHLSPNTDYTLEVRSADQAGQVVRRTLALSTPPEDRAVPPPVLTLPGAVGISESGFDVVWKTDVPASTELRYGRSPTLGVYEKAAGADNAIEHKVTVSGLDAGTVYYCQAVSASKAGEGKSSILEVKTLTVKDTDPPVIETGPVAFGVTEDGVTVEWTTDKAGSSELRIVEHEAGGGTRELPPMIDPSPTQTHKVTVTGLSPGMDYTLTARTTGAASGLVSGEAGVRITTRAAADAIPPKIVSGPAVPRPEPASLTVVWDTDEPSNSQVDYGVAGGEGMETRVVPDNVLSHRMALVNLQPDTPYLIRVSSADLAGNPSEIREITVRTRAAEAADKTAPKIVSPPTVVLATVASATVAWATDEDANGQVEYGTVSGDYDQTRGNATSFGTAHSVRLTGLSGGKTYYYRVLSTDALGNGPTASGELTFVTRADPDETPADIVVEPAVLSGTATAVILRWTTNELSDSRVDYTPDGGETQAVVLPQDVLVHTVTLTGLSPNTRYTYRVGSQDQAGNAVTWSESKDFRTRPEQAQQHPPKILSGPRHVEVTPTSATVVWTTDVPAGSLVEYGQGGYGERVEKSRLELAHTMTLTGLTPGTAYRYRVTSKDPGGRSVTTDPTLLDVPAGARLQQMDLEFTTPQVRDNVPPVVLEGPGVDVSGDNVKVSWTTDEPASGVVVYGDLKAYGDPRRERRQFHEGGENYYGTRHTVRIVNLGLGVRLFFRVESADRDGNTVVVSPAVALGKRAAGDRQAAGKMQPPGGFGSFITDTQQDTQAPAILSGPTPAATTANELVLAWKTDEVTTAAVRFRAVAGAGAAKVAMLQAPAEQVVEFTQALTDRQAVLNNLDPGTRYAYTIEVRDLSGNRTVSPEAVATTAQESDVTPPRLVSEPRVIYKTDRSATVAWDLDELGDGAVRYGPEGGELSLTRTAAEYTTSPSVTLTNLQPNTRYTCQVASSDMNRNGPTESTAFSFTTDPLPDQDAPEIVGDVTVVDVTDQSATVQWTTNELSDQAVRYGTGQSLDFVAGSTGDKLTHAVTLSNLQPGTVYAFQVESMDRAGNGPTPGPVMSFKTAEAADMSAPAVPVGLEAIPGGSEVVLRWTANTEDDLAGYNILRAAGEGDLEVVATRVGGTQYRDVGLTPGTAYRYAVAAEDRAANRSDASSEVAATPEVRYVPAAPGAGGRRGDPLQPTLVVFNVSPASEDPDRQAMTYEFQVSPKEDFSLIVASAAGITAGSGGTTTWQVSSPLQDGVDYYWRARAYDGLFNGPFMTPAEKFTAGVEPPANPGDFNGDLAVNFVDFLTFARCFNTREGDAGFNALCDFNGDGRVGFVDFLAFARVFGTRYGKPAGKPAGQAALPEDRETAWGLRAGGALPRSGATLAVQVLAEGAVGLSIYGVGIAYDESRLIFLEAALPDTTFLKSGTGEPAVFGVLDEQPGRVDIGAFLPGQQTAGGTGAVATLRFRVIDMPGDLPLVEIAEGLAAYGKGAIRSIPGGRLSLLPDGPVLAPVYPNPFNIQTTIDYGVRDAGAVRLDVYNTLGQRVVRLVDAHHEGGFYSVRWDGRDRLGRVVASGIYFARMQTAGQTLVRKMLLLK